MLAAAVACKVQISQVMNAAGASRNMPASDAAGLSCSVARQSARSIGRRIAKWSCTAPVIVSRTTCTRRHHEHAGTNIAREQNATSRRQRAAPHAAIRSISQGPVRALQRPQPSALRGALVE
jgi:hypothetical protein